MTVFDLVAKLTLDTKDYDTKLKDASKKMSSVSDSFKTAGKNITSLGKSIYSVGDFLTDHITKPALVAGTALGGMFLAKGWSRITQLDEAKAKLKALGNSANSVSKIMESANEAVLGTAFALDEAATTAASAVAAGIQQGDDLTKYLTTVADTAAIAGTSMADMGSIFNKVATTGKATNEVLGQLAERGIPIFQWLSEEIGVTTEEVQAMASKGEISLATFRSAVSKHVAGAAQAMGDATLTGALANLWAAVGRVGAAFLGSSDDANTFAGQLRPVIIDIKNWISGLQSKAAEWGKVFGEVFKAFVEWCKTGEVSMNGMSDAAKEIWTTVEPALDMLRTVLTALGDAWNNMSTEEKAATAKALAFAVALGPLLKAIGNAIITVGSLASGISSIIKLFSKFGAAGGTATASAGKTATAMKGITTAAAKAGSTISNVASSVGSFATETGLATAALEGGAIAGVVMLATAGESLTETLRGGNGQISEFGGALHSMTNQLTEAGKITSEQSDILFKSVEKWESAGDSGAAATQKFVMQLREMGVSSEDVTTAISSLAGQNLISADATDTLKSKVALLKDEESLVADTTTKTVTSFDDLKESVIKTAEEMNLTDYQLGSLMESMSKGDGSAEALAEAYNSLMLTTDAVGVETDVFAQKLGVTVPGATKTANTALNSTKKTTDSFMVNMNSVATGLQNVWNKGKDLLVNVRNDVNTSFSTAAQIVNQKTSDMKTNAGVNLRSAQSTISSAMSSIKSSIASNFQSAANTASTHLSNMASSASSAMTSMNTGISNGAKNVNTTISTMATNIKNSITGVVNSASGWGSSITNNLNSGLNPNTLTSKCNDISNKLSNAITYVKDNAQSWGSSITTNLNNGLNPSTLASKCNEISSKLSSAITGVRDEANKWGQDLVKNLSNGIGNTSVGRTLEDTLNRIAQKIKDVLGFSEPKEGPLSNFHTFAPDMIDLFCKGLRDNEQYLQDTVAKTFDFSDTMQNAYGVEGTPGRGITQVLNITSPQPLDAIEVARQTKKAMVDMTLAMSVG